MLVGLAAGAAHPSLRVSVRKGIRNNAANFIPFTTRRARNEFAARMFQHERGKAQLVLQWQRVGLFN